MSENKASNTPGSAPAPALRASLFRPHGRTEVWAEGSIVRVLAEGPFNREAIDAFSLEMLGLYRRLPAGTRCVNLTEVRSALLGTPDAWERLSEHLAAGARLPLALLATGWVVAPEVEGRTLMLPRARQAFADAGRPFEVFETIAEAEVWARRVLGS